MAPWPEASCAQASGVLASNGQLVERAAEIITRMGGRVLSPAEGREKMNLKRR